MEILRLGVLRPEIRHWANHLICPCSTLLASLGLAVSSVCTPFACVERNRDFREPVYYGFAVRRDKLYLKVTRSETHPGTFTRPSPHTAPRLYANLPRHQTSRYPSPHSAQFIVAHLHTDRRDLSIHPFRSEHTQPAQCLASEAHSTKHE